MLPARPRCSRRPSKPRAHKNFVHRLPEIAAARVVVLLRQGEVAAAAQIVQAYELPLSRARVLLAQGDSTAALAILEAVRQQMEAKHWQDELLKTMILQAVALRAQGDKDQGRARAGRGADAGRAGRLHSQVCG